MKNWFFYSKVSSSVFLLTIPLLFLWIVYSVLLFSDTIWPFQSEALSVLVVVTIVSSIIAFPLASIYVVKEFLRGQKKRSVFFVGLAVVALVNVLFLIVVFGGQ